MSAHVRRGDDGDGRAKDDDDGGGAEAPDVVHGPATAPLRLPADATGPQADEIQRLLSRMPAGEVLTGLRFAYNRWAAKDAGELRVGRKSIIRGEVHTVSAEQARWRLDNWKEMIAEYRRKGYSYPTISRIKKQLAERAASGPQ